MKFDLFKGDPVRARTDLLVVGIFEEEKRLQSVAAEVNRALSGGLQALIKDEGFKGEEGKTLILRTLGKIPAKRVCLLGLGKKKAFSLDTNRRSFAQIVDAAQTTRSRTVLSTFFGGKKMGFAPQDLAGSAAEGSVMGSYRFKKYLKKDDFEGIRRLSLALEPGMTTSRLQAALRAGTVAAQAVNFTRDLVNEPGNVVTPISLAATARKIARKGKLTCRILSEKEAAKRGMHAYLGVAQGSVNPPRFIHLTYRPRGATSKKSIALIGKGITFDSGGLSLKPPASMVTMKMDKAGACTVLGIMQALPQIKPKVVVHGIIAAAENMPGGKAQRPDDIVRAMNGKTIEVVNTDAEGRLTLADALSYAVKLKPERMIDMATLTGACVVALGEYTAGVMGNDKGFIESFLKTTEKTGEKMWHLPFDTNMKPNIKSKVADLKNVGNRWGGAITAGMFLEEFVGSIPWIHIDIAGPAFNERGWGYNPGGASGVGVRTVLEYITSL